MSDTTIRKESSSGASLEPHIPAVFKLRLELVEYDGSDIEMPDEDWAVLQRYAQLQKGFIREVLVPAGMSLCALHYMIQRLYGWQNSHIHRFCLPADTFDAVTEQGSIDAWERLCGVLFRFPNEEDMGSYDGYDGTQSLKTWMRRRYSGIELPFSLGDTYLENQKQVRDLEKMRQSRARMQQASTLDELYRVVDIGGDGRDLVERGRLYELLCPACEAVDIDQWLSDIQTEIQSKQELLACNKRLKMDYLSLVRISPSLRDQRISQADMKWLLRQGAGLKELPLSPVEQFYSSRRGEAGSTEEACHRILSVFEPKLLPLTHSLLYHYDLGDGWCVKITCLEGYELRDQREHPEEADPAEVFWALREGEEVTGDAAERLRNVVGKRAPVCVYADGLALLDDVGGIGGFAEMLKTLHGDDREEAASMREWANEQGWSGRAVAAEKLL